jgi:hypothetical protein
MIIDAIGAVVLWLLTMSDSKYDNICLVKNMKGRRYSNTD